MAVGRRHRSARHACAAAPGRARQHGRRAQTAAAKTDDVRAGIHAFIGRGAKALAQYAGDHLRRSSPPVSRPASWTAIPVSGPFTRVDHERSEGHRRNHPVRSTESTEDRALDTSNLLEAALLSSTKGYGQLTYLVVVREPCTVGDNLLAPDAEDPAEVSGTGRQRPSLDGDTRCLRWLCPHAASPLRFWAWTKSPW